MFEKIHGKLYSRPAIFVRGLGDYSLRDTMECGQCFRYEKIERDDSFDEYMTVTKDKLIRVVQKEKGELIFPEMDDDTFEEVARPYFNLDTNLSEVRDDIIARTDSKSFS